MWYYQNKIFEPAEHDYESLAGFVYLITEKETGMKYVGKKTFWSKRKAPPLKGKTRRRTIIKESDWRSYFGSSEKVQALVEENGEEAFYREILRLCKTKGEMSYYETKEHFDREVLLRSDYYNGIISCKINHNHVNHLKK